VEAQLQCQAAVALRQALAASVQRPGPIAVIIAGLLSQRARVSVRAHRVHAHGSPMEVIAAPCHDAQLTCIFLLALKLAHLIVPQVANVLHLRSCTIQSG